MSPPEAAAAPASGWDPAKYLEFAGPRQRPALDLLARILHWDPTRVVDLGCGTGHVTRLLAERWPRAAVTGIDSSASMLTIAARGGGSIQWQHTDLATWRPDAPADVIYSNAALHWLDDHAALFPRLVRGLAPGGVLAVQMPRNHAAPSHTAMVEAALAGPWRARLEPLLRRAPVASPETYHDLLGPLGVQLDLWETEYLHVLSGDAPVVEWTRGTALKPLLDALPEPEGSGFLADYRARIVRAYPPRADGRTLFPFRRLFIVAIR